MKTVIHSLLLILLPASWALAQDAAWSPVPEDRDRSAPMVLVDRDDGLGLPGQRPRLTMSMPFERRDRTDPGGSSFSWSLETWRLNTASLAHIQCADATPTVDSWLARDCRFVDRPLPDDAVNLVQVRGEWMAAPGLQMGLGAFHARDPRPEGAVAPGLPIAGTGLAPVADTPATADATDGLDFNLSFGIETDRVGDFLVGLQVARYRQRMSLADLGLGLEPSAGATGRQHYLNSARMALGWRYGDFSGDLYGNFREVPLWMSRNGGAAEINSFDLEFSWQALRNASLSIGVSNLLDAAPRAEDAAGDPAMDEPVDGVYGRIPYVRYKHDL